MTDADRAIGAAIAVCVKWVDLHPEVDPLHGTIEPHRHGAGFSESDLAAVEVALRLAEERRAEVVVACVGPQAADPALRELLACGAHHAVRVQVDAGHGGAPSSAQVARLLASIWPSEANRPQLVICGDASADRGSGSVPAFLAHELDVAQALGLVELVPSAPGRLGAVRRLDGGRRERLTIAGPAVVSVEGSLATLRRAPLGATLATHDAPIDVRTARLDDPGDQPGLQPWRPRPRALPAPAGDRALDRIVALTGALVDRTPPRTLVLEPVEAADAILEQLRRWGYLPDGG